MRTILLAMLLFSSLSLLAQAPGFKIVNPISTISPTAQKTLNLGIDKDSIYITPELIKYNYLSQQDSVLSGKLHALEDELYKNSKADPSVAFDSTTLAKKLAEVGQYKAEIQSITPQRDSLYHIYTKDYLQFEPSTIFSFGPRRSEALFDIIYGNTGDQFRLLNNTGFNIGNKTGSIYSELVSGNLGIFRVSLGAMVSNSTNDSMEMAGTEEAYHRLISNGGNTVINFEYPLAYLHSRNNQYNLISRLIGKGTADFAEFGTTTDKWAGSASIGINVYADAALSNNAINFFANFNLSQIYGTTTFQDNLGIDNSNFYFGQLTLGLVLANNVKLSFIVSTFSSEKSLNNNGVIAGGQILH